VIIGFIIWLDGLCDVAHISRVDRRKQMAREETWKQAIRDAITVPDYIGSAATACAYDLMHGPSWSRIPGNDVTKFSDDDVALFREDVEDECEPGDAISETYTGPVGDALRAFIDDLPGDGYVDTDAGDFSTSAPEAWEDDDGEVIEPSWECYRQVERRDIIQALFGATIAREFN
jgi:hypothetical protein